MASRVARRFSHAMSWSSSSAVGTSPTTLSCRPPRDRYRKIRFPAGSWSGRRRDPDGAAGSYSLVMCLICIEIAKSKMTVREARAQLREMREGMPPEHLREVEAKLAQAESAEKAESKP